MIQTTVFDVLIVYSHRIAASAHTESGTTVAPFSKKSGCESYNIMYGYFLSVCKRNKLKAAFTTSADIIGAGLCSSYWLFRNNKWVKVEKIGYSQVIFDKLSPVNTIARTKRTLLFSSPIVKPFNHPYLFNLFFDKQKAYKKLSEFSIPTVAIQNATKKSLDLACRALKEIVTRHKHQNDFSDEIIMKDRFGAEGENIYKFKPSQQKDMLSTMEKNTSISYIIQPFTKFDKGFTYKNSFVSADIRLIYIGGTVIQTYIRMAKTGDFRCNAHAGGSIKYMYKNDLPLDLFTHAQKIFNVLHQDASLYSLDFIMSNSGNVYLLEGNTGPGLNWDVSDKEDTRGTRKLIRIIVKQLVTLAKPSHVSPKKEKILPIELPTIDQYETEPLIPLTA